MTPEEREALELRVSKSKSLEHLIKELDKGVKILLNNDRGFYNSDGSKELLDEVHLVVRKEAVTNSYPIYIVCREDNGKQSPRTGICGDSELVGISNELRKACIEILINRLAILQKEYEEL